MDARLVKENGTVKISVNGETLDPIGYMTYKPDEKRFRSFEELKNRIVFFSANATDRGINELAGARAFAPNFFKAKGVYDFKEVDAVLEAIAPGGKGAYIIPRVYLSAPLWWARENPGELSRTFSGESPGECYASQKWREDMLGALKALIDHIESSVWKESVIGYQVAAGSTEEWGPRSRRLTGDYIDYSAPQKKAFEDWLKTKYGEIKKLNAAWGSSYSSFDEINVPAPAKMRFCLNGALRALPAEQDAVDCALFLSELSAETIERFCRGIKELTGGRVLTGSFYGYLLWATSASSGFFALTRLLESPYVDFVCTTGFHCPAESVRLHGKLFFTEADIRTFLSKPPAESVPEIAPDNSYYTGGLWVGPDKKKSVGDMLRRSAESLTRRTGLWWFDMWGGWFDDGELMDIIKLHSRLFSVQTPGPIRAETALIVDEEGIAQFGDQPGFIKYALRGINTELYRSGVPYEVYTAEDIKNEDFDAGRFRLVFFAGGCRLNDGVKRAVNEKLKRGGKTLVWTHFTGRDDKELTGFETEFDPAMPDVRICFDGRVFPEYETAFRLKNSADPLIWPSEPVPCPRLKNTDGAYILARVCESGEPAAAWRQSDGWSSVCSAAPGLPYRVIREIAGLSGVHVWSQTGDEVFAGGRFVALHALSAGEKRLHFPDGLEEIRDVRTGKSKRLNEVYADFEAEKFETRIFEIIR
ncbi:MAG: beta-galactosidase [Clostridia bacterium]|nr:beta-galactosidase [Clostridia bacterium]